MARKKQLCQDTQGRYIRNLGWKWTGKKYVAPKFRLGRDKTQAEMANLRLEQLWQAVCRRWEAATPPRPQRKADVASRLASEGLVELKVGEKTPATAFVTVGVGDIEYIREGKPVWDDVFLTIADAIRQGESVARVPLPEALAPLGWASPTVGQWLDQLRRDVPIHVELLDLVRNQEAEAQIQNAGTQLIEQGRRMVRQGGGDETLYQAFKAYVAFIQESYVSFDGNVTPTGTSYIREIEFLQGVCPDCLLRDFDTAHIHTLQKTIALRPSGKREQRIKARTAKNLLKRFNHFLRWLNRSPFFAWKKPSDLDAVPIRIPETTDEKSSQVRKSRVETYSIDELQVLWEYATPLKRLLLLLGLNCAFDAKMVASLDAQDIHLHQCHPHAGEVGYATSKEESWIFRLRNKTSVWGEWLLWPITVDAIQWWSRQREQIEIVDGVKSFLVNRKGRAYDTPTESNDRNPQLPNLWRALTDTIRKDEEHKNFRNLSFGKLRKTAGNLIRAKGGGEIAGVFLCHGTPVKADNLLDVYTNRPFAKVFETIHLVGQQLSPIWATVDNPFPERRKQGGSNISASKIKRIQKLRQGGHTVAHIAEQVGVSYQTVIRHSSAKKG